MEDDDVLTGALDFLGLSLPFSLEDLQLRYKELAKKFHPDKGEYTSPVLFQELNRSRLILENYLLGHESPSPKSPTKDDSYDLYKKAKNIENSSIIKYYEVKEKNIVILEEHYNPYIQTLRKELEEAISIYKIIIEKYPNSIWVSDAKASWDKLKIWFKEQ
jgi:hypothetical protein